MPLTVPSSGASGTAAITGGTIAGITGLGLRDTSAAFDVTLGFTSSVALTAARTLTLDLLNASRTVKLAGNVDLGGNFTTTGSGTIALGGYTLTVPATGTAALLGTANAFTAASTLTLATLGTTPTAGFSVINSTAAAAGAQQVSPSFLWRGNGWKTDATAASQTVDFRSYVLPVQAASAPTGEWVLQSSINGGAFSNVLRVRSNGQVVGGITGSTTPTFATPNNHGIADNGGTSCTVVLAGGIVMDWAGNLCGLPYGNGALLFGRVAGFGPDANSPILQRDANNTLAQINGTNAQAKRIYGTYTDASNYRRLAITSTTAGVFSITAEGAGTGASGNVLHISSLPTSNPGPGILWNNAGTPAIGT